MLGKKRLSTTRVLRPLKLVHSRLPSLSPPWLSCCSASCRRSARMLKQKQLVNGQRRTSGNYLGLE